LVNKQFDFNDVLLVSRVRWMNVSRLHQLECQWQWQNWLVYIWLHVYVGYITTFLKQWSSFAKKADW
jgi:hypothetical protein